MKKAASIFLRAEISPDDVIQLIGWMENPHVTRYLNEDAGIAAELKTLLQSVPGPLLSVHFNRQGRFFMIDDDSEKPIGFVKLTGNRESGVYEIVFAIGEESLWGNGYGCSAIRLALRMAFLEWRADKVIAKIHTENERSRNAVRSCGFLCEQQGDKLQRFSITFRDYLIRRLPS